MSSNALGNQEGTIVSIEDRQMLDDPYFTHSAGLDLPPTTNILDSSIRVAE